LVKIIGVVRNHQCTHNFFMTMIRPSGSQLHAARVLVRLSRETHDDALDPLALVVKEGPERDKASREVLTPLIA